MYIGKDEIDLFMKEVEGRVAVIDLKTNEYKNDLRGFYLDYEKDLPGKNYNSTEEISKVLKNKSFKKDISGPVPKKEK